MKHSNMRRRAIGFLPLALALSAALSNPVLGAPPVPAVQAAGDGMVMRAQSSSAEERAQRAREARAKVEHNRRCRPSAEKDYAAVIDDCKNQLAPEHASDRHRCFAEARDRYFKNLADCPG